VAATAYGCRVLHTIGGDFGPALHADLEPGLPGTSRAVKELNKGCYGVSDKG